MHGSLAIKNVKYAWNPEIGQAFERIKQAVRNAEKLYLLDPELNFGIESDASTVALGAKLVQYDSSGNHYTVAYASRSLRNAERKYTVTELEGLALVWALKKWRTLLMGRRIRVQTDHRALKFISACSIASARMARWQAFLQEFDLEIQHVAGVNNTSADVLSRKPVRKRKDKSKSTKQGRRRPMKATYRNSNGRTMAIRNSQRA